MVMLVRDLSKTKLIFYIDSEDFGYSGQLDEKIIEQTTNTTYQAVKSAEEKKNEKVEKEPEPSERSKSLSSFVLAIQT